MSNKKISSLTVATTPLTGTEVLPIVQSGATVKVTVADLTAGRTVSALNFTAPTFYASARAASPPTYGGNVYFDSDGGLNGGVGGVEWQYATSGAGYGFKINSNTANDSLEVGHRANSATWIVDWRFSNTGDLVQGTAAKGVNFTANTPAAGMTSQLLNWYEEGTWTPALLDSEGHAFTAGVAVGQYIRIGKSVTLQCKFTWSSIGSANASAMILTGFPWPTSSITNLAQSADIGYMDGFDTTLGTKQITSSVIAPSLSYAHFHQTNDNATPTYMPANSMSASGELRWSMTYVTN
jgi:hypothetical protein